MTKAYASLLSTFLGAGYEITGFFGPPEPKQKLLLRHDVDLSVQHAWQMAQQETEMGVRSTYFFLLCSPFYNLLELSNVDLVMDIKEQGHTISLHFDPFLYADPVERLHKERSIFKKIFGVGVACISFHKPFQQIIGRRFGGIHNTYERMYFEDIAYVSDSTGVFRHGHPLDSVAFREDRTMQLLLHPIWWGGLGPRAALEHLTANRASTLRSLIMADCEVSFG